ncbi:MAG: hypothetical protein NTV22_08225 [bacterium]|nr:hypothetical protein [bacterium]
MKAAAMHGVIFVVVSLPDSLCNLKLKIFQPKTQQQQHPQLGLRPRLPELEGWRDGAAAATPTTVMPAACKECKYPISHPAFDGTPSSKEWPMMIPPMAGLQAEFCANTSHLDIECSILDIHHLFCVHRSRRWRGSVGRQRNPPPDLVIFARRFTFHGQHAIINALIMIFLGNPYD